MVSLQRKILFYTFLLAFIIITPSVILYAIGYKIDLSDPSSLRFIQKTGMVLIETEPSQAKIFINDKVQKPFLKNLFSKEDNFIRTPAKIKGLLPEEYNIRLELEGYWPWSKKVNVNPGQITHIQDVKLFKKTLPLLINQAEIQNIESCSGNKIAYLPKNGLLINLKNENLEKISSSTSDDVCWSTDNKKLLAGNTIYNIKDPNKNIDLTNLIGESVANVKWNKNDSNLIYYQYKNSINSFNLHNQQGKTILDQDFFLDYLISNEELVYISKQEQTIKLKMYSINEERIIKEIELPYSEEYKLISRENNTINLYDEKYKTLYLIDLYSLVSPLKEIIENANHIEWINKDILLYAKDFEIWILNIKSGERKLLTRISNSITGIITTSDENYILYSTENSINVIELRRKNKLYTTELIKLEKISAPILSDDEKSIYFTARIGNQKGLYKLLIK